MWQGLRVFCGVCPDPECKTKLYFPSYAASSIDCTGCGQHHAKEALKDVHDVEEPDVAMRNLLRSALLAQTSWKGTELVKVKGYSNYHCKLLSPLFTTYGMDKHTGEAKLLGAMGQAETFDCSVLGDRAFQLEQEYLETSGYGRDKTGSEKYLEGTLKAIKAVNEGEERLIPLHVDGDGHCLVHALSRALVGREIFWHALRANLKIHLEANLTKYKMLFKDFIDDNEWKDIIVESDPNYRPVREGESMGLRNIHIFALANVLHRPIVLLDSLSGIQSSADYSGLFLPVLVPVHECVSKDGHKHKPLAIAWSSSGHNHYVPLVAVKGKLGPRLPQWLIPKAWGVPNDLVKAYVDLDTNGNCYIGGTRCVQDKYLQRLIKTMDEMFFKQQNISAMLVTEVHQFVYKPSGLVGILPVTVTESAKAAVSDGRLKRCLSCNVLTEQNPDVQMVHLCPGGVLYETASQVNGKLEEGKMYTFPNQQGLSCVYDAEKDVLIPVKQKNHELSLCHVCKGPLRQVMGDNSLIYKNGDRTTTPVSGPSRCGCGFKHFWDGKEYNNLPERIPITLEWGGQMFQESVYWFQNESDPSLNSNVYDVASSLVQKHFPGEFGSERLVQKVVNLILKYTAKSEGENRGAMPDVPGLTPALPESDPLRPGGLSTACFQASKTILTGEKHKTFHREELTLSDAERAVKAKTEQNAAIMQKRRTALEAKKSAEKNIKMSEQQDKVSVAHGRSSPSLTAVQPNSSREKIARKDKKIRLSTVNGKQVMMTFKLDTTFSQLQESIERELGIPASQQKIRHGFPPRELHPPESGKENDPVPLQHGDKVVVEQLHPPEPESSWDISMEDEGKEKFVPPKPRMAWEGSGVLSGRSVSGTAAKSPSQAQQQQESEQNAQLAAALVNALTGGDMLVAAQNSPDLFEKGGQYYNKVQRDLGHLTHDQHCTIPFFPGRTFAYNAEKDRLELCLGQIHLPIQPGIEIPNLSENLPGRSPVGQVEQTDSQASRMPLSSDHSFSGAIMHRDTSRGRVAFSGQGRSLLSPSTNTAKSQVLGSKTQTYETNTNLRLPSEVQAETRIHASIRENAAEGGFNETKTTANVTDTMTPLTDNSQLEVLDIEMRNPVQDDPSPMPEADITTSTKNDESQCMDTEVISPLAALSTGEQRNKEKDREKDLEMGTTEGHFAAQNEEKMETEISGPYKSIAEVLPTPDTDFQSVTESNQFAHAEVKTEHSVVAVDNELTSSRNEDNHTKLSTVGEVRTAETRDEQLKTAFGKEEETFKVDGSESKTTEAVDSEDVQTVAEPGITDPHNGSAATGRSLVENVLDSANTVSPDRGEP